MRCATMKQFRKTIILPLLLSLLLTMVMGILPAARAMEQEELMVEEDLFDSYGDPVELSSYEIVETPPTRELGPVTGNVYVPAYDGGTSSGWMDYDCGVAVGYKNTKNQSKLRIVTGTTSSGFTAWCTKLVESGFTHVWHRSCPAQTNTNRYAKYLSADKTYSIYTYFVPATKMTRIIVDTHVDTLGTFSYVGTGSGKTELYMYALSGMEDGWAASSPETVGIQFRGNAGSMFVIKMRDNSLFIIDGGASNQMGDRSCEELYAFLRSITGTKEGTKMVINTWFISHNHADHCGGFPRFLHKYNTEFDLLNIMYNFDFEGTSRSLIQRVSQMYPEAKYYKPHTGESFNVAGVQFDVLYAVEDRYKPNSSNKLILNDASCTNHINENNQSMVLRMTFDGKKAILTGDIRDADAVLMSMYPAADLKADILQIPHHNFDEHTELAKTVNPTVAFINQTKSANFNRSRLYNNRAGWKPYVGSYYYGSSETVGYRAADGVFYRKANEGHDFLQWGNSSYYIREENPITVTNSVKDPEVYYRYTKSNTLTDAYKAYLIVDEKLNRVLSYDAVGGTVTNAKTALYDGTNYYFSASQRRFVNWKIKYGAKGSNSASPNTSAVTHYTDCKITKGTGSYWETPTKNYALTLGYNDSFSATGFFGSRSPFSAQMESSSIQNSVDVFSNGSVMIYRNSGSTYYPLFRDGDATGQGGWGTAALNASTTKNRAVVLLNRLYAMESTASNMYISWSGHQDYYTYTGASKESVDTLLAADLRLTYSFDKFGGKGEMIHTSGTNGVKPNTYCLQYSPAYDASAVQDYTVTIKYKSANGQAVTVGSFNLHVGRRPTENNLYFDFNDDTAAREKYKYGAQYGRLNFDGTSRWIASSGSADVSHAVYTDPGVVKIKVPNWDASKSSVVKLSPYAAGTAPLAYNPKYAEVMQVRFRVTNMSATKGANPYIRLWYTKTENGSAVTTYDRPYKLGTNYVSDGKYMTATVYMYTQEDIDANASVSGFPTTTFANAGTISDIALEFHNLVSNTEGTTGDIVVDYIYIGPKKLMPDGIYRTYFRNEDGKLLENALVYMGETAVYTKETPTKAPDSEMHYAFAGWKTEDGKDAVLTNVKSDLTVYASYTAVPHSYAYHNLADGTHKGTCSCGYTVTEAHSYTDGICPCGETGPKELIEDTSLKLNHSLNLASDISVNLLVSKTLLEGYDMNTVYIESTVDCYEGNQHTGTSTLRMEPVLNGNYYYFTLNGLTAVQMNDRVSSVIYGTKNGQPYCSPVDEYSIASYAYSQLNNPDRPETLKTLCADLLRYGAKAQIFKSYRTDALADDNMTDAHKAYLSDMEAVTFGNTNKILNDVDNAPIPWAGKALDLESKVALKFVFNPANYKGDPSALTLKVSYTDINGSSKSLSIKDPELYNPDMGLYVFTIDALLAAELRAVVSVQVFAGDMPVSCTLQYSADTYGNNKVGTLGDLCKALFAYSDSAKAFFGQ